jgi:hypothetical protein
MMEVPSSATLNHSTNDSITGQDDPSGPGKAILTSKKLVWEFGHALERCGRSNTMEAADLQTVLDRYTIGGTDYTFRSVYPFRDKLQSTAAVARQFWRPLFTSFSQLQKRADIFIAGPNSLTTSDDDGVWVLSMGHFMGLFDHDWLGIRATRQVATLRYAEFSHVRWLSHHEDQEMRTPKIFQTALFLDIVGLMQMIGMNPLPPSTGQFFPCTPGPKPHDGLLVSHNAPLEESVQTQALVDRMIDDLSNINASMDCPPPTLLQQTWHDDMIWHGPAGIGTTYTIPRYQDQHQRPFRSQLSHKQFQGHAVRIAEGKYAAFFGWPMNLTNTPLGGFLGLPGRTENCPMQVVDVYRRDGNKLAENWVFIDLLWYLKHQGLDALERTTGILNPLCLSRNKRPILEEDKNPTREDGIPQEEYGFSAHPAPPLKKKLLQVPEVESTSVLEEKKTLDGDDYVHVSSVHKKNETKDETSNTVDMSLVTHAATIDISDVLNPKGPRPRCMPMPGFDETFVDIVDYILKITYWIWHEKKVPLCHDYYSTDCILHTMAGDIQGADTVVANTWSTLEAFPDRTLDGENVIWSREEDYNTKNGMDTSVVYYSSHLIVSRMTNHGDSEWGPATHKLARIRTIADCVCTKNKIVEEWLMRDNAWLVLTLGLDVREIAQKQAQKDLANDGNLLDMLQAERKRVEMSCITTADIDNPNSNDEILGGVKVRPGGSSTAPTFSEVEARRFAESLLATLWLRRAVDKVPIFYDYRVSAHLTAGRELYGTTELIQYLKEFQAGLSNMSISIDHVACIPYLGQDAFDVAIRWTLTAQHTDDSPVLGKASNAPMYILAGSHFRIIRNRIREEWTVFDELALLRQIETQRLINGKKGVVG